MVTVVRPRLIFLSAAVGVWLGGLVFLAKLQWDAAYFDPRMPYLAIVGLFTILGAMRAKLVIGDATLNRRRLTVALDRLASVEVRRAKFLKQEGWFRTLAVVTDRDGNKITFKPVFWRHSASDVLAVVQVCARAQGLTLDERTRGALVKASERRSASMPAWAYRTKPAAPDEVVTVASPKPSFWTKRNADGSDKKFQPQRLLALAGAAVVFVPTMLFVGRVGTHTVRSLKCADSRAAWTEAPEVRTTTRTDADVIQYLRTTPHSWESPPWLSNLIPSSIAGRGNTSAVQHDAQALVSGWSLRWQNGNAYDDVQVENFRSHAAAMRFHRDYAEDHCHMGDATFSVAGVPGAYGFRCPCTGEVVDDKVAFVRGNLRVQAIAWGVPTRDSHERAVVLAQTAFAAFNEDGSADPSE